MKKNNADINNPYSFYTLNESDVFGNLYYEENTESQDLEIDDIIIENEQIDVYSHQDDKILQEYSFSNGYTTLYRKFDDNKLALLYDSCQNENGDTNISIYNCTTFYTGILKSNEFNTIASMDAKDFLFIDKCFRYYIKSSSCKKH